MVKNTSLPFIAVIIVSLLFGCSSKKTNNSDLKANVTSFLSNTEQIVGFGYIDVKALKNKSQIIKIPELKKILEKTLGPIEGAVKLKDKLYYALAGTVKDNGPEVNYVFLNIQNKDSLQDLLEKMGYYFKRSKVNSDIKIYDDESTALGFDDHTLILVMANFDHDPKELLLNAFASFNKTKENSGVAEILDSREDILLAVELEHFLANTPIISKHLPEENQSGIEELVKNGYWTLGVQFNQGNLTVEMDVSRVNDQLKALYPFKDKPNPEIQQNLGTDSTNFLIALSLNMDHVDSLLNYFGKKQKQHLFKLLYLPLIVKGLIASEGLSGLTNGDLGAMVSNKMDKKALMGMGTYNKNFFLGLGKNRQNIIDLIDTLAGADQIHDLGDGYYQIDNGMIRLNKNNLTYQPHSSSKEDFKTGRIKLSADLTHFGEQPLSIYMNLQDDKRNTLVYGIPKTISQILDYSTLQGDNDGFTLKIVTKNQDENVLKLFLEAYKQELINRVGNTPIFN